MGTMNVAQFAAELKVSVSVLLEQLRAAGISKQRDADVISEADKAKLLAYLQHSHGTDASAKKITLARRETSEIMGSAMGTWGVSGALASVAALQVACGIRSSLAHLITFHVGGLLEVIGVAHLGNFLNASTARR